MQGLVIRLRTKTLTSTKHDALPKGASKGDRYTSTDKLINIGTQFGQKGGVVVGTDKAESSFTSATTAVVSGVATLPGGTITFRGVLAIVRGGFSVPVVGGTGTFAGVGGTLTVGSGKDAINTYALTLP